MPPLPAFELRCREAEWIDRPQTLVEFCESPRRAPECPTRRYAGLSEVLIADALARAHLRIRSVARGRVILSCETPRHGIPLGVRDLDRAPVSEWNLREQIDGDLLDIDTHGRLERSVAMQVRRGLIAVAGALPLLLTPMFAHAGDGFLAQQPNLEQLAAFGPPKLPDNPQPTPPVEQPTTTTTPTTTAPPVAEPPTPTTVVPPAPRVQAESLSLTGTTLWDGLLDKQVRLDMKGGQAVTGVIVAQTTTDLAVARTPDGTVVAVPKSEIAGVRLRIEEVGGVGGSNVPIADRPHDNGNALRAGGGVMVGIGAAAALSGTVMLAITPYALYISLPLLLPGLAMIGGGSAMLSSAAKKRKAYNKAWGLPQSSRLQMTPTLTGNRNGGMAGLVLRF